MKRKSNDRSKRLKAFHMETKKYNTIVVQSINSCPNDKVAPYPTGSNAPGRLVKLKPDEIQETLAEGGKDSGELLKKYKVSH
jgi:hypothetical protein